MTATSSGMPVSRSLWDDMSKPVLCQIDHADNHGAVRITRKLLKPEALTERAHPVIEGMGQTL